MITKDGTIELAHERLIDDRPKLPLKTWLAQDAADRRLIDQLQQRVHDETLPDGLLAQAEELLQRDHELAVEEPELAILVRRSRDQREDARSKEVELLLANNIGGLVLGLMMQFALSALLSSLNVFWPVYWVFLTVFCFGSVRFLIDLHERNNADVSLSKRAQLSSDGLRTLVNITAGAASGLVIQLEYPIVFIPIILGILLILMKPRGITFKNLIMALYRR